MGHEKTEIVSVDAVVVAGTSLTTTATVFNHDADEPVYVLRFDQVKVYRSTTGSSGTFDLLATVAMDVDNATLNTNYQDDNGLSSYYYKISYYHSVTTLESAQSDAIPGGTGFVRNTVGFLVDEILREVQDEAETTTSRTELLGWFNEVSDDLQSRTKKPYSFLSARTTLTRTANVAHIDWPTDANGNQTMWKFDHMEYNFVDTTTDPDTNIIYTIRVIPLEKFRQDYQDQTIDSTTVNDETQVMALDESVNRFRFHPPFETTSAGVFYLYYWKYFTQIDSEGDVFETPNFRVYKLYGLAKFYRKKAKDDTSFLQLSDRYFADYNAEVTKFVRQANRDAGSPKGLRYLPQDYKGERKF